MHDEPLDLTIYEIQGLDRAIVGATSKLLSFNLVEGLFSQSCVGNSRALHHRVRQHARSEYGPHQTDHCGLRSVAGFVASYKITHPIVLRCSTRAGDDI